MCTGAELLLPLLGTGLSFVGNSIQQKQLAAQAKARVDARNRVLASTLGKNDILADQARAIFDTRLQEVQPEEFDNTQAEVTEDRTAILASSVRAPQPEDIPLSGSAPAVVKSEIAKQMLATFETAQGRARQLGKLGGFGDAFFQQGLSNQEAGNQISIPNNFARGNLGILPHLQDFAEVAATKPISPIGGILAGLGNTLGTFAGGQGYFGGGTPAGFPGFPRPKPANV